MKVCFLVSEYFDWGGVHGGVGRLTKTLAENLCKRGLDVHVLVPRREYGQPKEAVINGVPIHTFGVTRFRTLYYSGLVPIVKKIAQQIGADIYHSEGETQFILLVESATKDAKHIVTCQDPEFDVPTDLWKKWRKTPYYSWEFSRKNPLRDKVSLLTQRLFYRWMVKRGLQNADMVFSQTHYQIPLIKHTFKLPYNPQFLPNPVEVPNYKLRKNDQPTVLYLARLDPVKRPWIFFKVAKKMPDVQFVYTGKSHVPWFDAKMRHVASKIPNLVGLGHIFEDEIKRLLEKSWILMNCSIKEALPVSWLEACAYQNAIVSCRNADNFASNFGVHIKDEENVDEYVKAIRFLISDQTYLKACQILGYDYVNENHELNKVLNKHMRIYESLVSS